MRPINSMIEFKQIIGRGTRLYDGKDYFTIYDFVKAHHHFNDPEWDGEPVEPEVCERCGVYPCECEKPEPEPCANVRQSPCECKNPPRGRVRSADKIPACARRSERRESNSRTARNASSST